MKKKHNTNIPNFNQLANIRSKIFRIINPFNIHAYFVNTSH